MPLCVCPHCNTQLWVKDSQLNLAQGYVVCRTCQGLFQARSHTKPTPENFNPDLLPAAGSDTKLVQQIGPQVRAQRQLSRQEIAELLDGILSENRNKLALPAPDQKKELNWTLPCMAALTVLIVQLFYLVLIL